MNLLKNASEHSQKKHKEQIKYKGITEDKVNQQLMLFKSGLPHFNLKSAASLGDGIFANFLMKKKKLM